MATTITKVSKAYREYWNTRRALKAKHRKLVDQENQETLIALGKEVYLARQDGYKVDDIMQALGTKNRNFMYGALEEYQKTLALPNETSQPEPEKTEDEPDYEVEVKKLTGNTVSITIGSEQKTLTVNKHGGITDMPEEWLRDLGRKRKLAIRDALAQTQKLFS